MKDNSKRNKSKNLKRILTLIWSQAKKSQLKVKCLKSTSFKITLYSSKIAKLSLEFLNKQPSLVQTKRDLVQPSLHRTKQTLFINRPPSNQFTKDPLKECPKMIWTWGICKESMTSLTKCCQSLEITQTHIFRTYSHKWLCYRINWSPCFKKLSKLKGT